MRSYLTAFLALLALAVFATADDRWPAVNTGGGGGGPDGGGGTGATATPCGGPLTVSDFNYANWSVQRNDFRTGPVISPTDPTESIKNDQCVAANTPHDCCTGSGTGDCTEGHNHALSVTDPPTGLWPDRFTFTTIGGTAPLYDHVTGSVAGGVGELGTFQITPQAVDSGGVLMAQQPHLSVLIDVPISKTFVYVTRFKVENASEQSFFVGLHETPPSIMMNTDGGLLTLEKIGVHHQHTDGQNVDIVSTWDNFTTTTTDNAFTITDDVFFDIAIVLDKGPGTALADFTHSVYYRNSGGGVGQGWTLGATHTPTVSGFSDPLRQAYGNIADDNPTIRQLWIDHSCWAMRRLG